MYSAAYKHRVPKVTDASIALNTHFINLLQQEHAL
jgi:hypothetical protein